MSTFFMDNLFAIYSVARLMYISLTAGDFGLVLGGTIAVLIAGVFYVAIGCWLHKTDWI
jgi:hypothetical protein